MSCRRCAYFGCDSYKKTSPNLSFYTFPTNDPARCEAWILNSGNSAKLFDLPKPVLRSKAICGIHFLETSFRDPRASRKLLTKFAVPVKYGADLKKNLASNILTKGTYPLTAQLGSRRDDKDTDVANSSLYVRHEEASPKNYSSKIKKRTSEITSTLPISSSKAIQDVTQLEPDMQISTKGEHSGVTKKSKANVDPHFFECQYNAADDGAVASTSRDFTNYDNFSSLEEEDDSYSDVPDFLPDLQPTPVDASVVKIEIEEEPLKIKNEPLIIENDPLTSDTYVEPTLPFIKEEPAEEPDQIALKNVDQLDESERQSIQMFFDSMARTVMNLSPSFVSRIKSEVLRVVSDIEMEANKKKMEQEPSRKTANVIAASDETEPRIEIKNENNEEAEASTKLDEPELLDPELLDLDHDANYEPLAKKKKIEQPSSSLQVHRTPRTLHEPVETFFQSIAYTVKSFPPPFVCKAKVAVLKVISKMEVEACRSHQSGYTDGGGGGDDSSRPDLLPSGSNY